MHEYAVLAIAAIGLLGILCQWLAWWLKLPAILFLLIAGVAAGPVLGWLRPDALFGELLFPLVSLAVAAILFEGSLTLRFAEIRGLEHVVRRMVTVGVLITWLLTAAAVHYALGFSWELAFLVGAVTVVTGPTVVIPMLRTVRPSASVANVLRWEGIVIDPIGAVLAVLVYEFIILAEAGGAVAHTLATLALTLAVGGTVGAAAGHALGEALRRHWLPEYLYNVAALTLVFGAFALSNHLQAESGLIAVTAMGMWLGNMRGVPVDEILNFKESLSVLLISGLFIVLAARVEPAQMLALGWGAVAVLAAVQLLIRPLKVGVSTLGSKLSWRERLLIAWIAPRGIVAAAISALFALRLEAAGYADAPLIVPLTFFVIIGTVVLQSATARPLAKLLGVAEPEPSGLLLIGANPLARAIGEALQAQGFRVLLADTFWENIKAARMAGLAAYYGNPVSADADRRLDLVGLGRMLGLSPVSDVNALAGLKFRGEFGADKIYALQTSLDKDAPERLKIAAERRGYVLFGADITYTKLSSLLAQGAEIRATTLTESFDFDAYRKAHGAESIPLFAVDPRRRLQVFVAGGRLKPEPGWTVIGLVREGEAEGKDAAGHQPPASQAADTVN